MPSTMNVAVSNRNTVAMAAVVRSEAMNMYAVKMPQAIRYSPTAWPVSAAGILSAKNVTNTKNEIQNAP